MSKADILRALSDEQFRKHLIENEGVTEAEINSSVEDIVRSADPPMLMI